MTSHEKYETAISEAKRFIQKAEKAITADSYDVKANAAAKRASMDLTRALADLRRRE